jgi:hypothetical protein
MCIICAEWEKGKMTAKEALRAIGETMNSDPKQIGHLTELSDRIMDQEVPMNNRNEQAEKDFWNSTHREPEDE